MDGVNHQRVLLRDQLFSPEPSDSYILLMDSRIQTGSSSYIRKNQCRNLDYHRGTCIVTHLVIAPRKTKSVRQCTSARIVWCCQLTHSLASVQYCVVSFMSLAHLFKISTTLAPVRLEPLYLFPPPDQPNALSAASLLPLFRLDASRAPVAAPFPIFTICLS